jgi:ribonuclease R
MTGKAVEVSDTRLPLQKPYYEEFMLIATKLLQNINYWACIPFVYRIHEEPDPEKIHAFSAVCAQSRYRLKGTAK